jgi:hypothetical protein
MPEKPQPQQLTETWGEYRRLVISELESLKNSTENIHDKLDLIKNEISQKIEVCNKEHIDRMHALDIRVNGLETKMYVISSSIGVLSGILVSIGKAAIEYFF